MHQEMSLKAFLKNNQAFLRVHARKFVRIYGGYRQSWFVCAQ